MEKTIFVLVMAEEKWHEAAFLCEKIESRGFKTRCLDMGLMGKPQGKCHITREDVIANSGRDLKSVEQIADRGRRMPVMVEGGRQSVKQAYSDGSLQGIISVGGTTGTQMGTRIMRALPFGVPKIAVSSTASVPGLATKYFGTSDITLMYSVVEFGGLDMLMKNTLGRAAGAICGMVEGSIREPVDFSTTGQKPLIAMTQSGGCEICAVSVRRQLEDKNYPVVGFSGSGSGERAMEDMIERQHIFGAVIDLNPCGVGEELLGFARAGGPTRLEAAGKRGLPQVIAPSGVNYGTPFKRKYKPEYDLRKKYVYDTVRTFIRLSEDELTAVADVMARKLNLAQGPVVFMIPLGGWSSVDKRGTDFYDSALDGIFINALKRKASSRIEFVEVDADLDTPAFAREVVSVVETLV